MAKCNCCGLEMLTADGCLYKRIVVKGPRKKIFNRIKVGDPGDWYEQSVGTPEEKSIRCSDCGAKIGYYHHYGCDIEKCPHLWRPALELRLFGKLRFCCADHLKKGSMNYVNFYY